MRWSHTLFCAAGIAAACLGTDASWAQSRTGGYPNKPIRLIIGFPPGGGTDIVARTMSPHLAERLGQAVLVENRAGASGNIGTDFVAKAAPDGYVIGISSTAPLTINQNLYSKLPYDPVKDLAPVTLVGFTPIVLVAHPGAQISSVRDLIALAKAKPGQLSYGSSGMGSVQHLSGEMLTLATGARMVHVAYKGDSQSIADLVGGQIPLAFSTLLPTLPHIRAGRLKALAITQRQRSAMAPEIPSIAETGVPDYDSTGWYGVVAPGATPTEIIARLNEVFVATLKLPDVQERMLSAGAEPAPGTPEQFSAFIRSEIAKWTPVLKATGARVD